MDILKTFLDDIITFEIPLPSWVKIGFIIILIIAFAVGGYIFRDIFDVSYLRSGFSWYIVIGIINLITILSIYFYYDKNLNVTGHSNPTMLSGVGAV